SKTFYLRIYSPLERHQRMLEQLQRVLEHGLDVLADRLESQPEVLDRQPGVALGRPLDHHAGTHAGTLDPSTSELPGGALPDGGVAGAHRTPVDRRGGVFAHWQETHARSQKLGAEIGELLSTIAADTLAPRALGNEIDRVRVSLDRLSRDDGLVLDLLSQKGTRPKKAPPPKAALASSLGDLQARQIAELERAALLFDDWIKRQVLEQALAISDEVHQHRERLQELLRDYRHSRSPQTLAHIERTVRALEHRLEDLAAQLPRLAGEIEDRFVSSEALETNDARDCIVKVRQLIEAGDAEGAVRQLERCGRILDEQARLLEGGLRALRTDKFTAEERAYSELLDGIDDLAREQEAIATESGRLADDFAQRAAQMARESGEQSREQARKTLEALKRKLAEVPLDGLNPIAAEENGQLLRRLDDVGQMIEQRDIAEALEMGEQAQQGLRMLAAMLEEDIHEGEQWSSSTGEALQHFAEAIPLLDRLLAELGSAVPSPEEVLGAEGKVLAEEMRRRQQLAREQAARLIQKAQKKGSELPGRSADVARDGLEEAKTRMARAEKELETGDLPGGHGDARAAADQLGAMRRGVQRAARPTTVGSGRSAWEEEPVRIPGASDYRPPAEFREDILEAMRRHRPPAQYRDMVKRYYEELVK
ncbi:MAG: hypothetical protein V2A73_11965, partial [Pseudomonadota bacterium]